MSDQRREFTTDAKDDQLTRCQKSFILLQFLKTNEDEPKLKRSELTPKLKAKTIQASLDFTTDRINQLLEKLDREGHLAKKPRGPGASYTLTEKGKIYLGESDQYSGPSVRFNLTGNALNKLLELARHAGRAVAPEEAPARPEPVPQENGAPPAAFVPPPPQPVAGLESAILGAFKELLREKFSHVGMVPIFEVRRLVGERLGPDAARHDVFDECVRDVRRAERLRVIPISDLRKATDEQLSQSIPGDNETLFYLKATIHEPS